MAIDVEQFTAPGKYYIDLKMEEIDRLLIVENQREFKEKINMKDNIGKYK